MKNTLQKLARHLKANKERIVKKERVNIKRETVGYSEYTQWDTTISFDEITPILIQSTLYENLGKVRWYGSPTIAQNHQITKNIDAALFAMKTNLSNPLYSIDSESKKLHDLKDVLEKQLHEVSSLTYSALAYDSYWIAALSLDKNNTIYSNNNNGNLTKSFKEIIRETAESFDDGISGKIKLNKAGDRLDGNYDFWIVAKDNETQNYEWEKEEQMLE